MGWVDVVIHYSVPTDIIMDAGRISYCSSPSLHPLDSRLTYGGPSTKEPTSSDTIDSTSTIASESPEPAKDFEQLFEEVSRYRD